MPSLPLVLPDPAPTFGGIRLRGFDSCDVDMLMDLSTDPYVPLTGSLPGNTDEAGALAYIVRQDGRLRSGQGYSFCVARHDTDEAVGTAGLWLACLEQGRATAGYSIAPRSRGQGLAADALMALTRFAWTIPELHRIELAIEPWNAASVRTAAAAGYVEEGLLRKHQQLGGRRVDMRLFAIIRADGDPLTGSARTPVR